jgi:hypothetical protein
MTESKSVAEKTKELMNNIKNMRDSTAILLITFITLFIILLVSIIYFFYFRPLRERECDFMDTMYGTVNGKIQSIDTNLDDFKYNLRDYYIKTAYNCCNGGKYKNDFVDTCSLVNVLKQGARGLDFEIYSIDDTPVIASSTDYDNYYIKETFNYVNFKDAMNIIRDNAFNGSRVPNPLDPIIVHLRIKSSNINMYDNFAKLLENYNTILLGKEYSYEYKGRNLGNVPLSEFMGKVIIIVDRSNISYLESPKFVEYVNMTSNSMFMRALYYYDIKNTPDINEIIEYNKLCMTIGMPDKGNDPDNPSFIVTSEMGCQMTAARFQKVDTNLENYTIYFDEKGYAFVLKPERLRYVPVTIPTPEPQKPQLSYATRDVSSDFYNFEI